MMTEGVKKKIEKRNMRDDDELELLLGEIPHATSSLNLHPKINNSHHKKTNVVDHNYYHASCVAQKMNGHGHGHGHGHVDGMYDDEFLKQKYACVSSPVSMNGFPLQSDGSSSSLLSGGELRSHLNRFWLDFKGDNENSLVDDFNLSRDLSKMYIGAGGVGGNDECVPISPNLIPNCDRSVNGSIPMNFENYGALGNYGKGISGGYNETVPRGPINFERELMKMQHDQRLSSLTGFSPHPYALSPQFYRRNVLADNNFQMGFPTFDVSSNLRRPLVGDSFLYASRNGMNDIGARDAFYPPNMVQLAPVMPHYNECNSLHFQPPVPNGRHKVPFSVRTPYGNVNPNEDSLIIQGRGVNYGKNGFHREGVGFKSQEKKAQFDGRPYEVQESFGSPRMYCPVSQLPNYSSLSEARGYIHHMAKDQHGCRFLQRMFDEGTSRDVQIIFIEIIDHVVELMINPFGNYLMQKLLEVCNEEQRMQILLRVTEESGQLVRISLNTHGTRVVQKLIETLKTRQQTSLVISALEPGFLALIKDLNGNHVVQRCLQCFTNEESKFIFAAGAKYCVDIAKHQHGCCVLLRCISHSTGEHRENLIAEISANGLLLSQDPFGNYVVQFILELQIPSAVSKLISQFKGNYVHLSTQKFSSHVVEKCLVMCNNEVRSKIIHELVSATYFEQLLQDPHANYVIQTALRVSEGHLHDSLVDAIELHKAISRNSPYSKRIFSHKLLKR